MPVISAKFQRGHSNGAPNGVGSDRPISRYISETAQDRDIVIMER